MFFDKRVVLALLATAFILAPGCSDRAAPGTGEGELAERNVALVPTPLPKLPTVLDTLPDPTVETIDSEYRFAPGIDPDVAAWKTEIWARVYRPKVLKAGKRYPLLVFMHGNHHTCGTGQNPRIDDDDYIWDSDNTQLASGVCSPNYAPVPSHEGYKYIADEMAAHEYIVVSINTNLGINGLGHPGIDSSLIIPRGKLLLKHIGLLSRWDNGEATPPASVGADLAGLLLHHLDFTNVGLMGHSRGGEGCRAAYNLYTLPGSPWPSKIHSAVTFKAIFEIGPTDSFRISKDLIDPATNWEARLTGELDAPDTTWAVLLPMCDGDIVDLQGVRHFDRMLRYAGETGPGFRSTLTVWGTNHNYYNTEWQMGDSLGCLSNPMLFIPGKDHSIADSGHQQEVGRTLVTKFFLANVGADRKPDLNALFDPMNALPAEIAQYTSVDRGFLAMPTKTASVVLDDFAFRTGDHTSNVTVDYVPMPEHDMDQDGARVTWSSTAGSKSYEINLGSSAGGISLEHCKTLDLRVDRAFNPENPLNPDSPTNFHVTLVNAAGVELASVPISDFATLLGPDGAAERAVYHSMLQTARIPLTRFLGPVTNIRGIRFKFDDTPTGDIYLADIRATKDGVDPALQPACGTPALPGPMGARPVAQPAVRPIHRTATTPSRRMATTFASGNVVAFGSATAKKIVMPKPGEMDIEVEGSTPFPVMDDALVLHIGAVDAYFSHYPDPRNPRRVVFTMSAADHRSLHGGEEMIATCGGLQWDVGRFSPAHVAR